MEPVSPRSQPLLVEVTDGENSTRSRHWLEPGQALTIGRDYRCDVVVDDPYVCPRHLQVRLGENGRLDARDLDSVNGLFAPRARRRSERIVLAPGQSLRFGHGQLRLIDPAAGREPTRRDSSQNAALGWVRQPWAVAAMIITLFVVVSVDASLDSLEFAGWTAWFRDQLQLAVGLGFWGGAWALANRLVSRRFNFFAHCAIGALGLVVQAAGNWLIEILAFGLDMDPWLQWLKIAFYSLLFLVVLLAHLRLVSRATGLKLALTGTAVVALGTGISVFSALSLQVQPDTFPNYAFTYKPPAYQLVPGRNPDAFLDEIDELAERLEARREEETDDGPADPPPDSAPGPEPDLPDD